jgi:ATP adenylyltransferase
MGAEYFYCFDKLSYVKGKRPEGCILCHIRDKNPQVQDLTVYRGNYFIVSINLYPYNPGHLLVFPNRHIQDVREYSEKENLKLNDLIHTFLDILDISHRPFGYNIGYNIGLTAGASISHLHCHIIPRYPRETGISDLIAGRRVLVEHPLKTIKKIKKIINSKAFKDKLPP